MWRGVNPSIPRIREDRIDTDATARVASLYPDHPGHLAESIYPTTHQGASAWLKDFLKQCGTVTGFWPQCRRG